MRKKKLVFLQRFLFFILVVSSCCLNSRYVKVVSYKVNYATEELMYSVVKISVIDKNGSENQCTAFAFDRSGYKYRFASDGHCFIKKNGESKKIEKFFIILRNKEKGSKDIYSAVLIGAVYVYKDGGNDFAILEAELDRHIPVLKFSKKDLYKDQCIVIAGFPSVAQGNIFLGQVLDDSDDDQEIASKVTGIKKAEGISGAPLLSCDKKEVIGIIRAISVSDENELYAIPIYRFKKWEENLKETLVE